MYLGSGDWRPMQEGLTKSTSKALSWSYAGSFVRLLLTFGVNILLTRLLGPKPFGLLAIAMLLFGLGNLLAGIGVTTALIQKPAISRRDIRFCFSVQTLLGSFAALILFLSAPAMAAFFSATGINPGSSRSCAALSVAKLRCNRIGSAESRTEHSQHSNCIDHLLSCCFPGIGCADGLDGIWHMECSHRISCPGTDQ